MKGGTLTFFDLNGKPTRLYADPELTVEIEQPIFLNENGSIGRFYLKKPDQPKSADHGQSGEGK